MNVVNTSLFNAVMRIESNFIATEFRLIIEGSAAHRPPDGRLPERAGHRGGGDLEGKKLTQEDSFVYLGRMADGG